MLLTKLPALFIFWWALDEVIQSHAVGFHNKVTQPAHPSPVVSRVPQGPVEAYCCILLHLGNISLHHQPEMVCIISR